MGPSVMFAPRDLRFGLAGEANMTFRSTIAGRHTRAIRMTFISILLCARHLPLEMRLWGKLGDRQPRGACELADRRYRLAL